MTTTTKLLRPLALAAMLTLTACGSDEPIRGEIELNDAFSADFQLVDMFGEEATDERFEGKPMLIYFGFTSCPDVCPAALSVLSATLDELGADASGLQPLFITVDPERDDPERLRQHLSYDDRILGLTGTPENLEEARDRMRVFASKAPMADSELGYSVDHQSMFFLTDDAGKPVLAFSDHVRPEAFADRLKDWL